MLVLDKILFIYLFRSNKLPRGIQFINKIRSIQLIMK